MKKIKGLLLAATLMLTAGSVIGQSYSETAAMFSRTRPTGTARMLGMGGAQVSLGGDMSSAYSNPAGLGMFNRSEFSISPGYYSMQNKNGSFYSGSTLLSDHNGDSQTGINIPAFGLVFSKPQSGEGFIRGTFAITMTRINDFNNKQHYEGGPNPNTSLIDYFINDANGFTPDQFDQGGDMYNTITQLAYYPNYLIGEEEILGGDPTKYFTDVSGTPYQSESIQTKGAQNQWNFSYGANFNDKFFLGAGLGIVALNFQSTKLYSEDFDDDGPLSHFDLQEDLQIKGTGINLTVGGIARPIDGLQLGLSISTPTRYNLTDTYVATLQTNWNNFDYYGDGETILNNESGSTDDLVSTYNLITPWKFNFGASYVFGKIGLISLDIERLNYGSAKYASQTTDVSYKEDNAEIKSTYTARTNVRLGGEVRVTDFRFRAGVGLMPDPYASRPQDVSNSRATGSLGIGYRKSKFYIDLAYVRTFANGNGSAASKKGNIYVPYSNVDNGPSLLYDQVSQNVMATIGFTF